MVEPTRWQRETGHTSGPQYAERMRAAAVEGDPHGEADLVDALLGAPSRVLDAGCGTGRTTIELARRGHDVTGVDLDPSMLAEAERAAPQLRWVLADLAALEPDGAGVGGPYDLVLLAGNVLVFVAPGTQPLVLSRLAPLLRPGGLLVAGFRLEPGGYDLAAYDRDAAGAGLAPVGRWATWERAPYRGEEYAVSVSERVSTSRRAGRRR